jgi:membrane peptidoglycan carboxypeptidase
LATEVLEKNVQSGTGTRAKLPRQPAGGKTGTAQESKDAWFVGYTPYLSTAVWMGNAEAGVEMRNVGGVSSVTGGSYPARIWGQFNTDYHADREPIEFTAPEKTRPGRPLRTAEEEERIRNRPPTSAPPATAPTDTVAPPTDTAPPAPDPTAPPG